jgi:dienelactone hydrolase
MRWKHLRFRRNFSEMDKIMVSDRSLSQKWSDFRATKAQLFWTGVGCAVATMVVGFTWGGWTTGGSAQLAAAQAGTTARQELAAAICVERFNAGGDATAQLAALREMSSWERGKFIAGGGWVAMPEMMGKTDAAATSCAAQLVAAPAPQAASTATP